MHIKKTIHQFPTSLWVALAPSSHLIPFNHCPNCRSCWMWPRPRCWRLAALWLWSTTRLRPDNTRCLQCSVRPTCPVTATCASWRSWIGKHRSWGCRHEIDESCWREVCCWLLGVDWWDFLNFSMVFVVLCSWCMIWFLCGQSLRKTTGAFSWEALRWHQWKWEARQLVRGHRHRFELLLSGKDRGRDKEGGKGMASKHWCPEICRDSMQLSGCSSGMSWMCTRLFFSCWLKWSLTIFYHTCTSSWKCWIPFQCLPDSSCTSHTYDPSNSSTQP